ncbi:unknown protein [Seminavis robusta]|uniref:RING-type domain-containing protein n=1 Tax=Seminavis robusta TaxID=568900 RepID=A0A9N8H5B8_9STRA|nr:unknown protein [Seminavis robusta]|eukprot:Sro139_g064980.1 n/a (101) ;mRNA; f:15481-15783
MANTLDVINVTGESCIVCFDPFHNGGGVAVFHCNHFICGECHDNLMAVRVTETNMDGEDILMEGKNGDGCPTCRGDDEVVTVYQAQIYCHGTEEDPVVID